VAFTARETLADIPDMEQFWVFVKRCFAQPRRMLRNNLSSYQYPIEVIEDVLDLRAQQIPPEQLLEVWRRLVVQHSSH
jgi:16S rRNA A1518/A1519 N6-dimethyltransferase RsmA/KsgA/DIM1 with predicted DNA glycosylase/AP lyase activity